MKFVTLVIIAMTISFGAPAQTSGTAAQKRTVAKTQQKTKGGKAKSSGSKAAAAKNGDATTLSDEKSYKAKWTFEQMLMRRLEIDAEAGEREKQRRKE
jgi:hypothetical protein